MKKKILARLGAIKTEATALLDGAEDGKLTEEAAATFDALMAEKADLEKQLERIEQVASIPDGTASAGRAVAPAKVATPGIEMGADRWAEDPMLGFQNVADFGRAVQQACGIQSGRLDGRVDERLSKILKLDSDSDNVRIMSAPSNYHKERGSADGYMVPAQIRETIWELVMLDPGILPLVNPEPTMSNRVVLDADESTPWGTTGIQAYWAGEGSQFTASRLATNERGVNLNKLYAYVLATEELLEDAARLNSRLQGGAARAIRYKADEAIVNGDGVAKPLGWKNADCLVTVAKEGGQAAATIVAANVAKMYARLLGSGGFWLAHKSCFPQLLTMTIGDKPVFLPGTVRGGDAGMNGASLFGLPVIWSEHCQTVGTVGDIYVVNPMGYYAAQKASGIKFAASMHLYFDYDIEAFRWTFRVGGQPILTAAVNPDNGSDTYSHFIALATRS